VGKEVGNEISKKHRTPCIRGYLGRLAKFTSPERRGGSQQHPTTTTPLLQETTLTISTEETQQVIKEQEQEAPYVLRNSELILPASILTKERDALIVSPNKRANKSTRGQERHAKTIQ